MKNFTKLLEELSLLLEAVPGERAAGKTDKHDFEKARAKMKERHQPHDKAGHSDKKKAKKDKKDAKRKERVAQFKEKARRDKTPEADKMIKGIQGKERDKVTGKGTGTKVGDNFVPRDVANRAMKAFAGKTGAKPGKHPDAKRDGKHYPFKRRSKLGLGPDGKHHYKAGVYPWKCVCAKGGCEGK